MLKRTFSALTLAEALQLVPTKRLLEWSIKVAPRPASDILQANLQRLRVFDLTMTEMAKTLLIDALFAEIVPEHMGLKVWKAMPLETDSLTGVTDYLITPAYAYISTPLLCVAEAKRDDFVQGEAQCIAEMVACRWKNQQEGHTADVYGIVSNGQAWQFYRLNQNAEVYVTSTYGTNDLPTLLGALDYVCARCAEAIPPEFP